MQVDRIAGGVRVAGSVRGLGVCDVLRVELSPVQRAGLETQLNARAEALEQQQAALTTAARSRTRVRVPMGDRAPADPADDGELSSLADELRLLTRARDSLPHPASGAGPFVFTGPAGLVQSLVHACLTAAVTCADARLGEGTPGTHWTRACERELEAAAAWIATALDCRAVEAYCFEPDVDPVHTW